MKSLKRKFSLESPGEFKSNLHKRHLVKNRKLVCIYSHKFAHHRTKRPMLYLICNSMNLFTEAFQLRRKSFQLLLISDTSGRYELCLYANFATDFDTWRLYPQVPIQNSVSQVIFSLFLFLLIWKFKHILKYYWKMDLIFKYCDCN